MSWVGMTNSPRNRNALHFSQAITWLPKGLLWAREQTIKPLRGCWMSKDRVAKRRIGHFAEHRGLNDRHHFAGLGSERRKTEDAVIIVDQRFAETTRLR